MSRFVFAAALIVLLQGCVTTRFPQDVAASFQHEDMQKLETKNAYIYYRAPSKKLAEHVAGRLEQCITLLRANTQSGTPREKMQVMITSSNFNNANVAPKILGMEQRMLLPEQMSVEFFPLLGIGANEIGDIACHEAVHYVHLEEANGFWRIVNAALGNVHQPNTFADGWFLEGLATYYEGNLRKTTGRPHNPLWRGLFESGAAVDPLDSGDLSPLNRKQLPVGGHYLVGQHFVEYLANKYGEKKLWEFVDVQGGAIFTPLWVTLRFKSVFGNSIGAEFDLYAAHLRNTLKPRARGPNQRTLDADIGYFARLAVARDGSYAVWLAGRDEVATLRVYEKDGRLRLSKKMTQVFPGRAWISSNPTSVSGLSFTADGKQLAFVLADVAPIGNDQSRALVLDASTGELLKQSAPFIGTAGEISADGSTMLIVESHDGTMDLAELSFATGKVTRLSNFGGFESIAAPAWSPDGARIAFSRWGGNGFDLFVRESDGNIRAVVTDGTFNYDARWADGERLVFMRTEDFRGQPYIAHVTTGAVERAHEVPYVALDPHLTSDGRLLFLNRDGWDWTLDEARVSVAPAQQTLPALTATGMPPREESHPPVEIVADKPYSQTDNAFYPGFRAPMIAPLLSDPSTGPVRVGVFAYLAAMGADRLGIHNWALQLQYASFPEVPSSVSGGYGNYLLAPWFTSISGAYVRNANYNDLQLNLGAARSFYTWPVAFSLDLIDRDRVTLNDGSVFRGRAFGPSFAISWSGLDSTPYTGAKRGLSTSASVSYFPRGLGSTEEIADLRGSAGFYVPLPISRRHTFNLSGVARAVPSERGGLLQVGGGGILGVSTRDFDPSPRPIPTAPERIGLHPSLAFQEPLRGHEDAPFFGDSVVIGNGRYRHTFIIDKGWASLLYLFPAYFIREVDLEVFGSVAQLNPDRTSGTMLSAAGASLAYRAAVGVFPVSLVYQYSHRFNQGLGDLHFVTLEFN